VIILEKAWAKVHSDYVSIIDVLRHDPFRDLTGAPGWMYQSNDDELWDKIVEGEQKQYMMASGISATT